MTTATAPGTTAPTSVDVAVIGGGIGGLSTVLALRAAGIDAHAFERTPALAPVGAALIVRVQSLELLDRWTDTSYYDQRRSVVDTMEFIAHDGTPITSTPLIGEPGDPDWGHSVHRADLFETLRRAVPDGALHLGRESTGLVDDGDRVRVSFTDGSAVTARAVVAADGIRSNVRHTLVSQDEPVFSGMINCRAVVPREAIGDLPNDRIRLWVREDRGFTIFPVRGGREIAYDAAIFTDEAGAESWSAVTDLDTMVDAFADFVPIVNDVIRAGTGSITAFSTYDREPIDRWTAGRVTLLGDAAHPMLPLRGQGANQAIQDAAALADTLAPALRDDTDVSAALSAYEELRKPRTALLQQKSRRHPTEQDFAAMHA